MYGTLMSPDVLQTLIGRVPSMFKPAYLCNFTRHPVKGYVFPGIIPAKSNVRESSRSENPRVEGILLTGLSKREMDIFDWFEDEDYTRSIKSIILPDDNDVTVTNTINANVYIWAADEDMLNLQEEWDYDNFRQMELASYLETTVGPCRSEIDRLSTES